MDTTSVGSQTGVMAFFGVYWFLMLGWYVLLIAGYWKIFDKAGQPGWAAIVPIYNVYVMLKVVNRPGWWLLLYLIPVVNVIIHIIVALDTAKVFGKGTGFAVGLILIPGIFHVILGFGSAQYQASGSSGAAIAA